MRKALFLLPAALLFVILPAYGSNLITNPGFETGDFTGWTTQYWVVEPTDPHTGSFAAGTAYVGIASLNPTTGAWIEQTLTTAASSTFNLTFWMDPNGYPNNPTIEVDVYWNGVNVGAFVSEPAGYHQYSVSGLVATSTSTVLEFTGRDDPTIFFIDDVDVEANGASGVPEPLSCVLSGLGLAFLALVRARRRVY
ncbi:MAG: hypothetical protein ABSC05_09940 [Candidatus Solibacter sp.]|jgi:flagellin